MTATGLREPMALDGIAHDGGYAKPGTSMPLHRVRFIDWAPSAISALAFLPSVQPSSRSLLAIGRDNGNIDLCAWIQDDAMDEEVDQQQQTKASASTSSARVAQGWVVDTTLVGGSGAKIETLAFVQSPTQPYPSPRLFSTSGGASITEHFLPVHLQDAGRPASLFGRGGSASSSRGMLQMSRTIASQGGAVWSMAASPLGRALAIGCDDGHVRIVDIEDGRFELLATSRSARRRGDGTVSGLAAQMDRAKTRIVSLAWGPPRRRTRSAKPVAHSLSHRSSEQSRDENGEDDSDDEEDDDDDDQWEDSFIIGGTTHSSALIWAASTGRTEDKLLVDKTRKEQTIVWSVATLPDGACILGDSLGHVSFFDGQTRTLLPGGRFAAHGKRADVLSLCIGPDGNSVYSGSVDQKVCEYALLRSKTRAIDDGNEENKGKWVLTGKRRLHAHDIRAVAIDPPYDPKRLHTANDLLPVIVSGGTDFNVVMTPASSPSTVSTLSASATSKKAFRSWQKSTSAAVDAINPISTTPITSFSDTIQRRMQFVPVSGKGGAPGGGSVVRMCTARRWILLRREKSIGIWKLPAASSTLDNTSDHGQGWEKMIEMQIKASSNLTCAEISPNGRFLFVSDLYESKLFELQVGSAEGNDEIIPSRVKSMGKVFAGQALSHCPGCSSATFSPDGRRLIIATHPGSFVHIIELPSGTGSNDCSLLKTFDEHRHRSLGARAVAGRSAAVISRQNGTAKDDGQSSEDSDSESVDSAASRTKERTIYERIDTVAVSPDGQYLVSVDTARRIHTFSLDTLHYSAPLPTPSQRPSSLAFDPWQPQRLTLVLPTNQIIVYDLEVRDVHRHAASMRSLTSGNGHKSNGINGEHSDRKLAPTAKLDDGFADAFAEKLRSVREGAIGGMWLSPDVFLLWGSTWLCTARRKIPKDTATGSHQQSAKRARDKDTTMDTSTAYEAASKPGKHKQAASAWVVQLTFKYQPLLFVGLAESVADPNAPFHSEIVVVERPYYDVARTLPRTYFGGTPYGV